MISLKSKLAKVGLFMSVRNKCLCSDMHSAVSSCSGDADLQYGCQGMDYITQKPSVLQCVRTAQF